MYLVLHVKQLGYWVPELRIGKWSSVFAPKNFLNEHYAACVWTFDDKNLYEDLIMLLASQETQQNRNLAPWFLSFTPSWFFTEFHWLIISSKQLVGRSY